MLSGVIASDSANVLAQKPNRTTTIQVPFTEYEWWLSAWEDNEVVCTIKIDHDGLPTNKEVAGACGAELASKWQNTPSCKAADKRGNISRCKGYYLHLVSFQKSEKEVVVDLPPPAVWLELDGCNPLPSDNRCTQVPTLKLVGEEPLPDQKIVSIEGTIDGKPFLCEAATCLLPLQATSLGGIQLEFWGNSSYGDSSDKFTAQVRVVDTGVPTTPGGGGWYVDVLSTQWRGVPSPSCAFVWNALPPAGPAPDWLTTPDSSQLLASGDPYYYLAGRLIAQGIIDASTCSTGGLQPNGYADTCGLEVARPFIEGWQNQFDTQIVNAAKQYGIPAQLMKNLFAEESQFWPGEFRVPYEYGLGQVTDQGADTILLWNSEFFDEFCPQVLTDQACSAGYLGLTAADRALLRGALTQQANSACTDCPTGVNLVDVSFTVSLFANMLKANCEQVAQIVYNATTESPGAVSNYEDLWRFTVANYHAGAGCVSYAIHTAWQRDHSLSWDKVAPYFTDPCKGVIPYVDIITK